MMDRTPWRRRWATRLAAVVLGTVSIAGCGNLTAGGLTGEAVVVVSGDADDPVPAASFVSSPARTGPSTTSHEDDEPEGELQVEFMVYLVGELGEELQLGEELEAQVDLRGRAEADVVREPVPAQRYSALRVVFIEIKAEVEAGLIINDQPVTGEVRVELDDLSLSVSRPIDLDVGEGDTVELLLDLNAPSWLQAVDPTTQTVNESVFASLIDVLVR